VTRVGAVALLLLLSAACGGTTLYSGAPPGRVPPGYAERWHSAFLFGSIPVDPTYDLDRLCPEGWSEIRLEPDEFTALLGLFTLFVYSPSRLTIVCAAPPGSGPPPLPELYGAKREGEPEPRHGKKGGLSERTTSEVPRSELPREDGTSRMIEWRSSRAKSGSSSPDTPPP